MTAATVAIGLLTLVALAFIARRKTVAAAQRQARRDAASGLTDARLRHPSMRGK
jgi:hypothetical protein